MTMSSSGGGSSTTSSSTRSVSSDNSFIVSLSDNDWKTKDEVKEAEEYVTREMEKLSLQERERILLDVHGAVQEEQIEMDIPAKLEELQNELLSIPHKPAYNRALELNRGYVENKALWKLFLEAENYNVKVAAKRLVFHFEVKQDFFVIEDEDDDILVRDVLWSDLDEADRWIASSGIFQWGSKRDNAGRAIFYLTPHALPPGTRCDSLCRALWYVVMSNLLADGCETSQKGVVAVELNLHPATFPLEAARVAMRVHDSLPLKTSAYHYVYPYPSKRQEVADLQFLFLADTPHYMLRTRNHHEDTKTIVFKLQTFGIPMEKCPATNFDNNSSSQHPVVVSWHLDWLESIQDWERSKRPSALLGSSITPPTVRSSNDSALVCIIPRRFDVLFGKNKDAREHTGTMRGQHLVNMHRNAYDKATSRREKTQISDRIVSLIHQAEGRFLRWEKTSARGGRWVVVEDDVARDKVAHMFRNMRAAKGQQRKKGARDDNIDTTGTREVEETNQCKKRTSDGTDATFTKEDEETNQRKKRASDDVDTTFTNEDEEETNYALAVKHMWLSEEDDFPTVETTIDDLLDGDLLSIASPTKSWLG